MGHTTDHNKSNICYATEGAKGKQKYTNLIEEYKKKIKGDNIVFISSLKFEVGF